MEFSREEFLLEVAAVNGDYLMTTTKKDADPMLTSRTLLKKVKAKDRAACERFFAIYWPFVLKIARSKGLNEEAAKDVAQETMIDVWKGLDRGKYRRHKKKFKSKGNFRR